MARQGLLIDVRGLQKTDRALREIAPDLRRMFYRDLGSMVKARVTKAKKATPFKRKVGTRSADPRHARTATYLTKSGSKRDISAGTKQGLFGFKAIAAAQHASILNLAASGRSKQGQTLVETLNARYGPAPRMLAKELMPGEGAGTELWRESQAIVAAYVRQMNARLDSMASSGASMSVTQAAARASGGVAI